MNELVNPLAENYASAYTNAHDALLEIILQYTQANHRQPHMISGHVQGRLLATISKMLQPQNILEIGTFTGFSTLCLAEGLHPNGELHTIELRSDDAAIAQNFFTQSAFEKQIFVHVGNAVDIIPQLQKNWDLVFLDADKVNYLTYYQLLIEQLKPGAIILADNVLFHGEVLAKEVKGKNAIAIEAFNKFVAHDVRVEQVMLTVRDGLTIIRKK
jgi:caffeoyl-CoA O-methyltransferase